MMVSIISQWYFVIHMTGPDMKEANLIRNICPNVYINIATFTVEAFSMQMKRWQFLKTFI